MTTNAGRVACIADTHLVPDGLESKSLFPGYIDAFPFEYRSAVYDFCAQTIRECHDSVMRELCQEYPFDLLVHLGDVTCGYRERGIAHESAKSLVREAFAGYGEVSASVLVCWSNHDTGYQGRSRVLDLESLAECEKLSPLFWERRVEGVVWVGICSALMEKGECLSV